jgi:hypothetical protein
VTEAADEFELWDLRVEIVGNQAEMVCDHKVGDYFCLSGENLSFPDGQPTDAEIACPDPNCGARFRITRTGKSTFRHGEVTAVPLPVSSDE